MCAISCSSLPETFFKGKKQDALGNEQLSSAYRAWRDYFSRCIEEHMPPTEAYTLLHSVSLVGLFTCIFIKSTHRTKIRDVYATEVKTGMGGLHGNKVGARFVGAKMRILTRPGRISRKISPGRCPTVLCQLPLGSRSESSHGSESRHHFHPHFNNLTTTADNRCTSRIILARRERDHDYGS